MFCSKVVEYTYTQRLGFYISLRCFEGNFEKCFFPQLGSFVMNFVLFRRLNNYGSSQSGGISKN